MAFRYSTKLVVIHSFIDTGCDGSPSSRFILLCKSSTSLLSFHSLRDTRLVSTLLWFFELFVFSQSQNSQIQLCVDLVVLLFHLATEEKLHRGKDSSAVQGTGEQNPLLTQGRVRLAQGGLGNTFYTTKHLRWETETLYPMVSGVKHKVVFTKGGGESPSMRNVKAHKQMLCWKHTLTQKS